jgi:predicted nuclease of predicted toxin-antitoxin system
MKLLFDHNLSPRLVSHLADLFPNSTHVYLLGLDQVSDVEIWQYAKDHGYLIVSRDADFSELSVLHGYPPKLIWLRRGNCTTKPVELILRSNYLAVAGMNQDPTLGLLILF